MEELSEKTGIRKEYIKKIESGKDYGVTLDKQIFKISNALKIKLSTLFNF